MMDLEAERALYATQPETMQSTGDRPRPLLITDDERAAALRIAAWLDTKTTEHDRALTTWWGTLSPADRKRNEQHITDLDTTARVLRAVLAREYPG